MGLPRRLCAGLGLRVNEAKSAVDLAWNRKLLGYSFWVAARAVVKCRVASKALGTMKERVRLIRGWKEYFRLADTPRRFADLDEWIRHRPRGIQLKHWTRGTPFNRELRARGLPEHAGATVAANGHRWWKNSAKLINVALPISYFDQLGVPRLAA
jgi:RNA-directed DNA polymerase